VFLARNHTKGGWNTSGINVQRSTRGGYHSLGWS